MGVVCSAERAQVRVLEAARGLGVVAVMVAVAAAVIEPGYVGVEVEAMALRRVMALFDRVEVDEGDWMPQCQVNLEKVQKDR